MYGQVLMPRILIKHTVAKTACHSCTNRKWALVSFSVNDKVDKVDLTTWLVVSDMNKTMIKDMQTNICLTFSL